MGLEDVLRARGRDLVGILNGVDYGVWSPERDPFLREHYDATDLAPKRRIKQLLVERLKLAPDVDAPLVGVVSRLVEQKGIDLVTAALPALLRHERDLRGARQRRSGARRRAAPPRRRIPACGVHRRL